MDPVIVSTVRLAAAQLAALPPQQGPGAATNWVREVNAARSAVEEFGDSDQMLQALANPQTEQEARGFQAVMNKMAGRLQKPGAMLTGIGNIFISA